MLALRLLKEALAIWRFWLDPLTLLVPVLVRELRKELLGLDLPLRLRVECSPDPRRIIRRLLPTLPDRPRPLLLVEFGLGLESSLPLAMEVTDVGRGGEGPPSFDFKGIVPTIGVK
jgi:hypothetical protein